VGRSREEGWLQQPRHKASFLPTLAKNPKYHAGEEPMMSREPWGLYVATIKTLNKPKNGK